MTSTSVSPRWICVPSIFTDSSVNWHVLPTSGVQLKETHFHFRRTVFSSQLMSKVDHILVKDPVLRIMLNIDGSPIVSRSHTHPSHTQNSRRLTSSLSSGVPVPHTTVYPETRDLFFNLPLTGCNLLPLLRETVLLLLMLFPPCPSFPPFFLLWPSVGFGTDFPSSLEVVYFHHPRTFVCVKYRQTLVRIVCDVQVAISRNNVLSLLHFVQSTQQGDTISDTTHHHYQCLSSQVSVLGPSHVVSCTCHTQVDRQGNTVSPLFTDVDSVAFTPLTSPSPSPLSFCCAWTCSKRNDR